MATAIIGNGQAASAGIALPGDIDEREDARLAGALPAGVNVTGATTAAANLANLAMTSPLPAISLLKGVTYSVSATEGEEALSGILNAFGADELTSDPDNLRKMGPQELALFAMKLSMKGAQEGIKKTAESQKLSVAASIEQNNKRITALREQNKAEERAEQRDNSIKGKIAKFIEPILTGVTSLVTIAIGVAKLVTFNPTGALDIASGVCGLVAMGLQIAMAAGCENEDVAKAALAFDVASMALGLIGGVAGGLKSAAKAAASKIAKSATAEALEAGGKAALKAGIEAGAGAVGDVAQKAAKAAITKAADDIGTQVAQKLRDQLSASLEEIAKNEIERAAKSAGSSMAKKAAQKLLDAPAKLRDAVVKQWKQAVMNQFSEDFVKKTVSDQLQDLSAQLIKSGKKGDDLGHAIMTGANPKFSTASLAAVSALEIAAEVASGGSTIWTSVYELDNIELRKQIKLAGQQVSLYETLAKFWDEEARADERRLTRRVQDMANNQDQFADTIKASQDVLMLAASHRA